MTLQACSPRRPLFVLVLLVALTLRLANALFIPWQGDDLVVSDMKGYDRAAVALLEQKPLGVHTAERYLFHPLGSDTYHPPAYYYFLAAVYAVAGHSYLAVRIAQALLDTLTCLLIYGIGRGIFGEAAGVLAAMLAAIYLPFIFYSGVLLTETLSTCLLAGATWLLLHRAWKDQYTFYARVMLAGLLLGLAALTRSVLLVVVPFALLWLFKVIRRRHGPVPSAPQGHNDLSRQPVNSRGLWGLALRCAVALCVPVLLVIAPISWRNYQIHHQFILISTNGGVNFFLGHGGTERWKNQVRNIPETYSEGQLIGISTRTAPEEEAYFYQLGWDYIRQHPLRTLLDLPAKLRQMYWDSDYWPASDTQANMMRTIDLVLWKLLLLPLSLLSLCFLRLTIPDRATTYHPGVLLLYLILISSLSIPLFFWAQTRFRLPFVPYFIILAAGTAYEIYNRFTKRSRAVEEGTSL